MYDWVQSRRPLSDVRRESKALLAEEPSDASGILHDGEEALQAVVGLGRDETQK